MKNYICKYCGKEIKDRNKIGVHLIHCKKNPKYQQIKQKRIKSFKMVKWKSSPKKEYKFNCQKCGKQYKLLLTQNTFNKGNYKKNCSRICANSRKHSQQTKRKISNSLKKQKKYYCISCNIEIKSTRAKYCKQCNSFNNNKQLFKKLNINETNLKIAANNALKKLYQQYYINELSLFQLKEKYGIMCNTIHFFFKKMNKDLRSFKQASLLCWQNGKLNSNNSYSGFDSGWHKTWNNKDVYLRSSYQKKVAQFLDQQQIEYQVQGLRLSYLYNGFNHTYLPDFYLPKYNLIIQTKSDYFINTDEKLNEKIFSVKQNNYKFLLINDEIINNSYKEKILQYI